MPTIIAIIIGSIAFISLVWLIVIWSYQGKDTIK